jgi:hypothetical protein
MGKDRPMRDGRCLRGFSDQGWSRGGNRLRAKLRKRSHRFSTRGELKLTIRQSVDDGRSGHGAALTTFVR